jgi:endogenous inhibitor of DNA gyrase (YacG/DUF329 family)
MTPQEYNKPITLKQETNGYFYFQDKDHPLAYKSNYRVYFHRHCASIKLGRWIERDEHTHHLDGNKQNNKLDNLMIVDNSTHAKIHNPIQPRKCRTCQKSFYPKSKKDYSGYCHEECKEKDRRNRVPKGGQVYSAKFLYERKTKITWPTAESMSGLVW